MSKATGDWRFVRISVFGLLSDFVIRVSSFSSPRLSPIASMNDLRYTFRKPLKNY